MRRALALLAALLAATSLAAAGGPRDPDIRDANDVRDAAADITAAWFVPQEDGLRFSIRVEDGTDPRTTRDHIYWFLFTIEDTGQEIAAVLGYGNNADLRGHITTGPDSGGLDGRRSDLGAGGIERFANGRLLALGEIRARPMTLSATIPWDIYPGFEEGATLVDAGVGTSVFERGGRGWHGAEDRAAMDGALVLTIDRSIFPILVPAWVIPTVVIVCTILGAGTGAGVAYAARKRPPAAAAAATATSVPVHTAPPPGERFQTGPGMRR